MTKELPPDTTVGRYMEHYMPGALNRHADRLDGIDSTFEFDISGEGGGLWGLTIRERTAAVAPGPVPDARLKVRASAADWMELVRGRLNGPLAFMTGRIKIEGDWGYAMKLGGLLVAAMGQLKGR